VRVSRRQRFVSDRLHAPTMSTDVRDLLHRLVGGDPAAGPAVVALADQGSPDPAVHVAAAVLTGSPARLDAAAALAKRPRERQLVALTRAHLGADRDLFDALVRDHLATYPDQLLAAWLAARPADPPRRTR
jgi:hypothetical protein